LELEVHVPAELAVDIPAELAVDGPAELEEDVLLELEEDVPLELEGLKDQLDTSIVRSAAQGYETKQQTQQGLKDRWISPLRGMKYWNVPPLVTQFSDP